jgi:hypothetical protein
MAMIYADGSGAPAPNQGGVAGAFYPPAATVRDLEAEGVLGDCNPSVAWSAGVFDAFANAARDMRIQGLEARLARLEEVVTSLLKEKQQTQGAK